MKLKEYNFRSLTHSRKQQQKKNTTSYKKYNKIKSENGLKSMKCEKTIQARLYSYFPKNILNVSFTNG
jgi:hypothetical protein